MSMRMLIVLVGLQISVTCATAQEQGRPKGRVDAPAPTEKKVYKTVGDQKLELWIWKPTNWQKSDQRSGVVFYHGGGWRNGTPNAFARQSARLAKEGMVAISVQYRLTSQEGVTVEDCVKDARSAFRWVRAHAGELGIDPARIAAGGGSAGGHLAATLVTLDQINDPADDANVSTHPAALVLFNPALVLGGARAARATGATDPEKIERLSPFHHLVKGHPPTIILHGEADTTVPIASVRQYAAKVVELGGHCEVVGYDDAPHSFFNRSPHFEQTTERMVAFLKTQRLLGEKEKEKEKE